MKTPIASLCISLLLLAGLFLPHSSPAAADSSLPGFEAALNPAGSAYEINAGGQGKLVISDYGAGEIWQVDPAALQSTIFQGIPSPSDARLDDSGNLWWADFDHGRLGELPAGASEAVAWTLPGAGHPYGTFVDTAGQVWVSDNQNPYLFHFNPSQHNTLCAYHFPDEAVFSYLAGSAEALWAADINNARLYRLAFTGGIVTSITGWALPTGSVPQSLIAEAAGGITWIDLGMNSIVRLDPGTNQITSYRNPSGYYPGYLTRNGSQFWFTRQSTPGFGRFDPAFATSSTASLQSTAVTVQPTCADSQPGAALPVTITKRALAWSPAAYAADASGKDWAVYALPKNALPAGIVADQNTIWMVDSGRKTLVSIPLNHAIYLPIVNRP